MEKKEEKCLYNVILFDLDGTLTDPGVGITNSVAFALQKYHINVEDRTLLYPFIGPPLTESFQRFYGFSKTQAVQAVEYYREYFSDHGIFENEVYLGIEDLLHSLKKAGKTLAVATSKPEVFAKRILEHFRLSDYFTYVAGSNLDGSRTAKYEVIEYALSCLGHSKRDDVLMIGDREHDMIGAAKAGIDSLGVLYGYGSLDELTSAGAGMLADSVSRIGELINL